MNVFCKYCWSVCFFVLCVLIISCRDEEAEVPQSHPNESVTQEEIGELLENVIVEWGISGEQVIAYMDGFHQLQNTDHDMLQFMVSNKDNQSISYLLHDGKLCATTILFPALSANLDLQNLLNGYVCVGELNDCMVYENIAKNTMATVWQPVEMDSSFSSIGFFPIQSEAYEQAEPIEVSTDDEISVGMFEATLSGKVLGVDAGTEVGFIYGTDYNLSEVNGSKVSTTSNDNFTLTVKGLMDETTYYYCSYAKVDDFYYLGDVKSFHTKPFTYTIDGHVYKMVRVEGGAMPAFSIMQTELPPNSDLQVGESNISKLNKNGDNAVTKAEFRTFLEELREATGVSFRLPTKAEWEFAASGGNKSMGYTYSGSNSIENVAWYMANSNNEVHDIARKKTNELGLYDMSGNYAELTNDTEDECHVDGAFCGGSWKDSYSNCKVTSWKPGITSGTIPGSKIKEKNAFNATYITVRLVYSIQE